MQDRSTAEELQPDVELRLFGNVSGDAVRRLCVALDEVVELRPEHLIVDLQRCTGLEPAVIVLLRHADHALAQQGGALVLRGPSPEVARTLLRSGLLGRAQIHLPLQPSTPEP